MNALELCDALETQFGNPLGPKLYDNVKLAVKMLKEQDEEIKALQSDVMELTRVQEK
jgi:hypothetical protein